MVLCSPLRTKVLKQDCQARRLSLYVSRLLACAQGWQAAGPARSPRLAGACFNPRSDRTSNGTVDCLGAHRQLVLVLYY